MHLIWKLEVSKNQMLNFSHSILTGKFSRLLKERDELNDQVSTLQIEMGLKASPLEGNQLHKTFAY